MTTAASPRSPSIIARLGGLDARVSRRFYLASGLLLAVVKLALDNAVTFIATGHLWSPLAYYLPKEAQFLVPAAPEWSQGALALLALPFIWIGTSMSVRRAADAGRSPWLGFLFLVPVVNLVAIVVLSALPTAPLETWGPTRARLARTARRCRLRIIRRRSPLAFARRRSPWRRRWPSASSCSA